MIQSHHYHSHRRHLHFGRWELRSRQSGLHVLPHLPDSRLRQTHSSRHFVSADLPDYGWYAPEWRLGCWTTCFAIDVGADPCPAIKERKCSTRLLKVQCSLSAVGAYDSTYCVNFHVGGCCPSAASTILPSCCLSCALPGAFLVCFSQCLALIHLPATMYAK